MTYSTFSLFKRFLLIAFILTILACDNIGRNEQQVLQNARTYLDKGELKAASIELRNALQKNNENAEARYLLGNINLRVGDLISAEKEFRRAADAGWNQEAIQLQLARIFINKKAFKELLDEIKPDATWSTDTRANTMALRALAEAGLKDTAKAKITLEESRTINKDAIYVLRSTAILQLAGILEGDASNTLEIAKSLYPENPEILLLHASNDAHNKNFTHAADTYSKVIALDPAKIITMSGRRARISLARLHIIEKNHSEATRVLDPLLKNNGKDPEANYLAGLLTFAQGDFNRAEDHVRKVLAIAPNNLQAQQLMGKIKYAQSDFDQAAHHLSNYLNTVSGDNDIRKLLTKTYIITNQQKRARATLQPLLTTNPEDVTALTLLSQIELNSENQEAGILAIKKAIKASPQNALLHKQLAKIYITTGKIELAKSELNTYENLSNDTEGTQRLTISVYLQTGQIKKALNLANEMLEKDPENVDTLALIGGLYADSGDNQQARTHFNKAIQIHKNHPVATMGLARIERKNGNFDKATSLYKSLIKSNTGGTIPMLALSEIAAQQNRSNEMLSWLEKARNATSTEIRARMILAQHYLKNAQPEKAEIYTKEALKQSPELNELVALHSKVLIAQQRYSEALPPLKKLVDRLPESTNAHTLLGETFLRQRILTNARKHLQKALAIQQNNIIAISLLAETELKSGNLDKSLEHAKALQKEQPESHIGHMQEGNAWMAMKNDEKAYLAYDNAWKLRQTSQLAQRLFFASRKTLSLNESIKPLLTWLEHNPDDSSAHLYLAAIYQNAEQNEKAIYEYEKILQKTPDNSTVLNNLAWLYSLDDNPKAMDMAERAYRFSPENPGILDTYGWILVQQGQTKKGQRLIKQALDVIPENPDIRYHYASSLLQSGSKTEGKQILEALLNQNKPFDGQEKARQLLNSL